MSHSCDSERRPDGAAAPLARAVSDAPDAPLEGLLSVDRRRFLETSGFGLFLSALAGCVRPPTRLVLSAPAADEGAVPGRARYYASVCGGCPAACGVLVKTRDGRPIKLEGNPDHPVSRGGLCAVGQAEVLSLYDSQRLREPMLDGRPAKWPAVDQQVRGQIAAATRAGRAVVLLTETIHSPTTRAAIARLIANVPNARHIAYDPLSASAIAAAHQKTHGRRVVPRYRFDRADAIVSLGADFLGPWISPVEHTAGYASRRPPAGDPPQMSYHLQIESRMSLTGCNADERWCVPADALGAVAGQLAAELAGESGRRLPDVLPESPLDRAKVQALAERLRLARGRALVVCDSQDVDTQIVVNLINHMLDGYDNTLDITLPSQQRQGDDEALARLIDDLENGGVGVLVVAGVNPLYDSPFGRRLKELLSGPDAPYVVRIAQHADETTVAARCVCPESHWLESWGDAEPVAGVMSVRQPTIVKLGSTRTLLENLLAWTSDEPAADDAAGYHAVSAHWGSNVFPRRKEREWDATRFWEHALRQGAVELESPPRRPPAFRDEAVESASLPAATGDGSPTLILYPTVAMLDGRPAHNPWLQELPDPVTKATWDNYACLSARAASRLGLGEGDTIRITAGGVTVEAPVLIQPGQHDRAIALALGYGRSGTDRFARIGPQWLEGGATVGPNNLVGVNAAPLLAMRNGCLQFVRTDVTVEAGGGHRRLALTQRRHRVSVPRHLATPGAERREMVEETTLAEYRRNPKAGAVHHHQAQGDLWPDDHPYRGRRWGMVIDLNRCTGCSACVVACQAENNVPVVGRDEVLRSREMHWIRIDRYYRIAEDDVDVAHQPMLCQHCANAPCEAVCPVLATVHTEDGLNAQVYNRCVGTRYCANNCPYKVRRFNWFEYSRAGRLENAALNPDVTVRSRGVMEKCSFCVQRLREATVSAGRGAAQLADGAVQTACQQSCPAGAIVFGDLNDPESAVAKAAAEDRCFYVLAELNVRPSVGYLRVVRHRERRSGETHHV